MGVPAIIARGLLVSLLWLGVATGQASAVPGWAPTQPVGTGLTDQSPFLGVDVTPAGAATIVWRGSTAGHPAILARARPPGGPYAAPTVLSRGTSDVGRPALAVARNGLGIAAWAQKNAMNRWVVQAALRSSTGAWSDPEQISGPTDDPPNPYVGIADTGAAVAGWLGSLFASSDQAQVAYRPPGGAWSQMRILSSGTAEEPHVVIDRQGNATALWLEGGAVFTSDHPAGGTWSVGEPRTDPGLGAAFLPHLAVGADGRVAAIFFRGPPTTRVQAIIRPPGGAWGAPEQVENILGSFDSERPQIALDAAGTATAVTANQLGRIETNRRPANGAWAPDAQPLPTSYITEVFYASLAVNDAGFALIGYLGVTQNDVPIVHGTTRAPATAWTVPPTDIGRPGGPATADVDGEGNGLVAWVSPSGVVNARAYDRTAPRLLRLDVPATGVAERPLALAVTAQDRWSARGPTTWSFGDGTTATGDRPTHTYRRAGTYTVRATVRDALGNASSAQDVVAVAPAPPALTLGKTRFMRAAFRRSRLSPKTRVLVKGAITAPARVSLRLKGPVRSKARERVLKLGTRRLRAGALSERVRIPKKLARRMLPGTYELRVTGAQLVRPASARLRLRPPPEGVVMAHRISNTRRGPNALQLFEPEFLYATFTFAPGARSRKPLRAVWYAPGRSAPLDSIRVRQAWSSWENPQVKGRWRCVLKAGQRVVDSVSVLVK